MSRSLGCTDTGLTVASGLVTEGEFAQVAADHIELDFDVVESLAVVDSDEVSNHIGHDNCISEVGFDWDRLLTGNSVLLGLFAFGIEPVVLMLDF